MQCWWQTGFTALMILCDRGVFGHFSTAFYVDNDQLQSVPLHVTKKVGAYLESNIVELLGIKKHGRGVKDELATRFMTQLYKKSDDDLGLNPAYKYLENGTTVSAADEKAIGLGEADTIVSFRPHLVNDRFLNGDTQMTFKCPELFSEGRLLYSELRVSFENASRPSHLIIEFNDHSNASFSLSKDGQFFMNVTSQLNSCAEDLKVKPVITLSAASKNGEKNSLSYFGKWYSFGIASFSDSRQRVHFRTKRSIPIGQENFEDPSALFTSKPKSLFSWKSGEWTTIHKEWVIAPDGFYAQYCDGSCSFPLTSRMNATNHAIVQTLVYLIDPKKTTEPKCAPTVLKPMKILFVDYSRNVILKRYRDMMVEDCGCQ